MKLRYLILSAALAPTLAIGADVCKSVDAKGVVIYSDGPCTTGRVITLNAPKPSSADVRASRNRQLQDAAQLQRAQAQRAAEERAMQAQRATVAPVTPERDPLSSTQRIAELEQRAHEMALARERTKAAEASAPTVINTPAAPAAPRTMFCSNGYCW